MERSRRDYEAVALKKRSNGQSAPSASSIPGLAHAVLALVLAAVTEQTRCRGERAPSGAAQPSEHMHVFDVHNAGEGPGTVRRFSAYSTGQINRTLETLRAVLWDGALRPGLPHQCFGSLSRQTVSAQATVWVRRRTVGPVGPGAPRRCSRWADRCTTAATKALMSLYDAARRKPRPNALVSRA